MYLKEREKMYEICGIYYETTCLLRQPGSFRDHSQQPMGLHFADFPLLSLKYHYQLCNLITGRGSNCGPQHAPQETPGHTSN